MLSSPGLCCQLCLHDVRQRLELLTAGWVLRIRSSGAHYFRLQCRREKVWLCKWSLLCRGNNSADSEKEKKRRGKKPQLPSLAVFP